MAEPAQAMFADDVASRSLGMELVQAAEGTAVVRMRVTSQMVNGYDIVHGGYLFMLADTAFACACNSWGPVTVAAGADITFVAPGRGLGHRTGRCGHDASAATARLRPRNSAMISSPRWTVTS